MSPKPTESWLNNPANQSGDCGEPRPTPGKPVATACGGWVNYSPSTPCTVFHGKPVYFCLQACKDDYDRDPRTSCLAGRILMDGL
jgi:YHS domain-containing protein